MVQNSDKSDWQRGEPDVRDCFEEATTNFHREETAACSEQVLFPDFNKQATLTPFKTIPIEFTPEKTGEYGFQCAMGMLHGKLIVE